MRRENMQKRRLRLIILSAVFVVAFVFSGFSAFAAYMVTSSGTGATNLYRGDYTSQAELDPSGVLHFDANLFGRDDTFDHSRRGERDADTFNNNLTPYSYGLQGNYWYWQR